MSRADEVRRVLRGRALQIPSDIWESATAAVRDDGSAELGPLMAAMLATTEYEWAWAAAMCEP